jgi:signal transduction histidine kinase/ActR/RegA family two-component response regulator
MARARPQRILHVQHPDAGATSIADELRSAGFDVVAEHDLDAVLRNLRTDAAPDLVLVGAGHPAIDAAEIVRVASSEEAPPGTKIVVIVPGPTHGGERAEWLELGAHAVFNEPCDLDELVGMVRVLLRTRALEVELHQRTARLADADRRKDEFLAVLAHELRNPLNVMTTSLALLADRPPRDAVEARALAAMQRQTDHLRYMVDDLLDVSRVTRGELEIRRSPIDLVALLGRTLTSVREIMTDRKRQTLATELGDGPLWVAGDPVRLEQVFVHLLGNASKYTPEHGHIEVQLKVQSGRAQVTVHDDGLGMSNATLSGLFGVTFHGEISGAPSSTGLGVGLALAKALVEAQGGSIAAHSEGRNRGSRFVVELPITDAPLEAEPAAEEEAHAGTSRTVLLVEDNDDARDLLHALCTRWGHRVLTAASGEQALAVAEVEPIDAAVIDLGLPGIDGYEVARRLRASNAGAGIRLIALTGYGSHSARDGARRAGFDFHLVKPCEPDALRRVLDPSTGEN